MGAKVGERQGQNFSDLIIGNAGDIGAAGGGKGLQLLHGRALIDWVLDAVSGYSDEILINANEDQADYARAGCKVIADQTTGWAGPLAGLQSALRCAKHDWVLSVPCDTPFLPDDLFDRLAAAIHAGETEAAVAVVDGRRQPTIALYKKSVGTKLDDYLSAGKRKAAVGKAKNKF